MWLAGWVIVLFGVGLVIASLNLDTIAIMSTSSLDVIHDPELALNKMRFAVVGGFAFVGGVVLLGAESIVSALNGPRRKSPAE